MKTLKEQIATPCSTLGMGNPMAPDGDTPGSGDMLDISSFVKDRIARRKTRMRNKMIRNKNKNKVIFNK